MHATVHRSLFFYYSFFRKIFTSHLRRCRDFISTILRGSKGQFGIPGINGGRDDGKKDGFVFDVSKIKKIRSEAIRCVKENFRSASMNTLPNEIGRVLKSFLMANRCVTYPLISEELKGTHKKINSKRKTIFPLPSSFRYHITWTCKIVMLSFTFSDNINFQALRQIFVFRSFHLLSYLQVSAIFGHRKRVAGFVGLAFGNFGQIDSLTSFSEDLHS